MISKITRRWINTLFVVHCSLFVGAALTTSCSYDDDSTLPGGTLPTIELADFPEEGYTVVSYEGNHLQITPDITTTYAADQLTYCWLLMNNTKAFQASNKTPSEAYDGEVISQERNLDYDVNLAPGNYTLLLDVTAQNGMSVGKHVNLVVTTNFTSGYYILKETPAGQTEFDIYKAADGRLIENLFEATTGSALSGTPCALSMASSHCYIDDDTNEQLGTNLVTVTTNEGALRSLRTSDLKCVFSNDNISFDKLSSDVRPYVIASGQLWTCVFLASDGVRSQYTYDMSPTAGKYGVAAGGGASRFFVFDSSGYNAIVWNERSHSVVTIDYNGGVNPVPDAPGVTVNNLAGWECLACGWSSLAGGAVFLLQESATGRRQLVTLSSSFMGATPVAQADVSADSHLARGSRFSVSNRSSSFIYTLDGGHIYAYDINTGDEQEVSAQGVGSENIAYISDKWIGSTDTDYLVIGTQQGDQYTLRFYNQLGGKPDGAPVYTTTGTGRVVSIMYTNTSLPSIAVQD